MSNKKNVSTRLKNTLNELDTAINQWDSLTSKPQREQVTVETDLQKRAKNLLKELRDQIQEFDEPLAENQNQKN